MDRKLEKLKGSYTVEMALISGVWLLVIFASMLLILGTCENVWDTAVCCETAVYGSGRAVCRVSDGIYEAKEKIAGEGKPYLVSGNKREISVEFQRELKIPFFNLNWKRSGIQRVKVITPVLFIEKVQRTRRFLGNRAD